jgi:putative peptidoglycan lipid II flippase
VSAGSHADGVEEREDDVRPGRVSRSLPPVPPPVPRRNGPPRPAPKRDAATRDSAAPLPPPPYPFAEDAPVRGRQAPPAADRPARSALPPVPPPSAGSAARAAADRPVERRPERLLPPVPPPPARRRFVPGPDDTQLIPVLPAVPRTTPEVDEEADLPEGRPGASKGILRAAGAMAVATLVSRITGLLRTVILAAAIGQGVVSDAYNTSNTLPNIVYELLLGGVLSSIVVPLLVRAQERDRDGGVGYAQRLATVTVVGLTVVTLLAVLCAPALTWAYGIRDDPAQVGLANWLARLLLLEIVFYGIGALATAILNSRDVFGAPAWAPVLNNVVVIATGALFIAGSGTGPLTPVSIQPWQVWLLGIGTTLGIAVQALVLLPLMRRAGVPLRPRWGLRQVGLREAGTLGLWVIAYAAVSQVSVMVATNVANDAGRQHALGSNAFFTAFLLFMMPYGIIGVALLTALLPRMSRAASRSDTAGVVRDYALGTRLSALGLLPLTALLTVLGGPLVVVVLARGNTSLSEAQGIGTALAVGAFGLLPLAVTLLQLRVFYAVRDARTPTFIQTAMVALRVPLLLLVPAVVSPSHVVAGLMFVHSVTYVAGWVLGEILLRRRFGAMNTRETLGQVLRIAAVSAVAGLLGALVVPAVSGVVGTSTAGSLVTLLIGTVVIGAAALAGTMVARVPELTEPLAAVRARFGRG